MRSNLSILALLFFISVKGQNQFDSFQVERILLTFSVKTDQVSPDENLIKAVGAVDKKFREITDTLYGYTSLKHTIFQSVFIETDNKVLINPLLIAAKIKTSSILFNNKYLHENLDSIARRLKRTERRKMFSYLERNFDYFSMKDKKLKPKAVRILYIKFPDNKTAHVGIDIYGKHFLWTIDKSQNWDVVKVEGLWVY